MNYPSNRERSLLQKLIRPSQRKKAGLFIAEGRRVVEQIIQSAFLTCEYILVPEAEYEAWNNKVTHCRVLAGESALLDQISATSHSQQIFAICREPDPATPEDFFDVNGLLVTGDALQDPGNAGTIYRSAVWFGASGWIQGKGTVDLFQSKVVRSTAGATGALPHLYGELSNILPQLNNLGWDVSILDLKPDSVSLHEWQPSAKQIIVVCNEGSGPSPEIADQYPSLKIPGASNRAVESLNASISAGIAIHSWFEKMNS